MSDLIRSAIRTIPDFPVPGIQFRDITTLLLDARAFSASIDLLADAVGTHFNLVAGIEARGFVFAAALAHKLGKGVLLLRKKNKLPGATLGVNYALEYGQDRIEMHADALPAGARVLLVDDLIATGGTARAAVQLLRQAGGIVEQAAFVIDLPELGGASLLEQAAVKVTALVGFEGH